MFTSQEVVDITPGLLFPSELDETPRKELEVDLTDQNLGIGLLIPASKIDNSIIPPGHRVEDAEGVDLSSGVADAVVGKLEANGFLELGHHGELRWATPKKIIRKVHESSPSFILGNRPAVCMHTFHFHHCGCGNCSAFGVQVWE